MRSISLTTTAEAVSTERARRYLAKWPLPKQAEALHDAANGRPEKLAEMNAFFAAVKADLPYPKD